MDTLIPTISALEPFTGLSAQGEGLLLKLSLSDGRSAWGRCFALEDRSRAQTAVTNVVEPWLVDHPSASLPELIRGIDLLRHTVTVMRPVPADPNQSAGSATLSRRSLITGLLNDTPKAAATEAVNEEQPLQPNLRFGLSQALLSAAALSADKSSFAILQDLVALPATAVSVPLLVDVNACETAVLQSLFSQQRLYLGYSTGSTNHKATLGDNAERLQNHVRQVKEWLARVNPGLIPTIHLDIQGSFSELYENDTGKLLGALYGLEQTAKPYPLVVENMITAETESLITVLKQLQSYLQVRQLSVRLSAASNFYSPGVLNRLVAERAVHDIHLDIRCFGTLLETLDLVHICRQQEIGTIIHAGAGAGDTAVATALTIGAKAISGPPTALFNKLQMLGR